MRQFSVVCSSIYVSIEEVQYLATRTYRFRPKVPSLQTTNYHQEEDKRGVGKEGRDDARLNSSTFVLVYQKLREHYHNFFSTLLEASFTSPVVPKLGAHK